MSNPPFIPTEDEQTSNKHLAGLMDMLFKTAGVRRLRNGFFIMFVYNTIYDHKDTLRNANGTLYEKLLLLYDPYCTDYVQENTVAEAFAARVSEAQTDEEKIKAVIEWLVHLFKNQQGTYETRVDYLTKLYHVFSYVGGGMYVENAMLENIGVRLRFK